MKKEYPVLRIRGVFSQKTVSVIGTGTTARKTESVAFFVAEELEDGRVALSSLGAENQVFGKKQTITREELLEKFLPEPQRSLEYLSVEGERQQEVTRHVARGDKFYKRGEHYSAEFEYGKALALDEENVRANFGIGLCYIAHGDRDKARLVFERLVEIEATFEPQHKHLFNEFGIRLRTFGMHEEALTYYARAAEISPDDENLLYNMARAAFGKGEMQLASQHLESCLQRNPGHHEAQQFLAFLKRSQVEEAPLQ